MTIPTILSSKAKEIWERHMVVGEARSWIGTPYQKGQCVKGAGVDCGLILLAVYQKAGVISKEDSKIIERSIPVHQDWFCHTDEEKYMKLVIRHVRHVLSAISYRTMKAKPGCIALTHHRPNGTKWNHGGIVTSWPRLVHAIAPKVVEIDATQDHMWNYREVQIYDPWAEPEDETKC